MDAAYFSAAIPEPFQILGLPLKPLSLGRYRLLRRFGCAFVSDTECKPSIADLVLGVLICSMTCKEFLEEISNPKLITDVHKWGEAVGEFEVDEKFRLFLDYIHKGSSQPLYWSERDKECSKSGDWSQGLEAVLRGEMGWCSEEIEEAPLAKAIFDYFKWADSKGIIKLMTDEEIELIGQQGGE